MDGVARLAAHRRLDGHRHVLQAKQIFTQRDGRMHARWRNTLLAATRYMDGLLSPGKRKSMRSIASRVGLPEDRVEQFIRESPWNSNDVPLHLMESIPDEIASNGGALILDDVGVPKQGKHSVGVYRQYCGETGKIDNCQIAVNLVYTRPGIERNGDHVTWPLGMQLYIPKAWLEDPEYQGLRTDAGIPEDHEFQVKPMLGLGLVEAARGVPHCVVLGDAGYGDHAGLRQALRHMEEAYILGVTPTKVHCIAADAVMDDAQVVGRPATHERHHEDALRRSAKQIANEAEWTPVEWGVDSKGQPLVADVHAVRVRVTRGAKERRHVSDEEATLLLEKRPHELKAWLCWGVDWSLEDLVAYAHLRWTIEQFHRDVKQGLGFGDFEGRTLQGWNHHAAMVLLAHTFVATLRLEGQRDGLPAFEQVVRVLQLEQGVQLLMREHGLPREKAEPLTKTLHQGWVGST